MSLALYRKYRPKKFSDILGQPETVTVLQNAAKRDRLAHAYVFYGSRGTGKTTAARLIAKVANCETRRRDEKFRASGEPCNTCRPCLEIDKGMALDVVEIDAASNRGIDEIRALKESVRLSPTSYAYKVFIIDESHQLTKEAWNALLKTLEEPPSHAIFILATTEYEKVPSTISSRAQRFHFRKPSLADILEKLKEVVAQEKLSVDPDALELIAASADGSFRDAESLLDQLSSGGKVSLEDVEQTVGKVGFARITELAEHILSNDLSKSLAYIRELSDGGANIVDVLKEFIQYLRRALTLSVDPASIGYLKRELTERELKMIEGHSSRMSVEAHAPFLRSLIAAWSDTRYSPFASIPFEVAVIEYMKLRKGQKDAEH